MVPGQRDSPPARHAASSGPAASTGRCTSAAARMATCAPGRSTPKVVGLSRDAAPRTRRRLSGLARSPVPRAGCRDGACAFRPTADQDGIVWGMIPYGDANMTTTNGRLHRLRRRQPGPLRRRLRRDRAAVGQPGLELELPAPEVQPADRRQRQGHRSDLRRPRPGARPGLSAYPSVPRRDDRLLAGAVIRVARTGAPRRDLPERFGLWNLVFQRFHRRAKAGVRRKLLHTLRAPDLEALPLDSTVIRAHHRAAALQKKAGLGSPRTFARRLHLEASSRGGCFRQAGGVVPRSRQGARCHPR